MSNIPRWRSDELRLVSSSDRRLIYSDSSTDTGQAIAPELYQTQIEITLSDGTNTATATLTLPLVAEAKGLTYDIIVHDAAGGVTLQDQNDSRSWDGDFTLDANDDKISLRSDGVRWIVVDNSIS